MNTFSIEYPEYFIAERLSRIFKKTEDYSISIPLSRQQKHYDLLLFNANNRKTLSIQVKSSRTYLDKKRGYDFNSWLNNFKKTNPFTDYYFIYITYPIIDTKTFTPKSGFGTKLLVFNQKEMEDVLKDVKTKKNKTPDKFFGFGFDMDSNRIFGTRGFIDPINPEFTNHLFEKKIEELKNEINN